MIKILEFTASKQTITAGDALSFHLQYKNDSTNAVLPGTVIHVRELVNNLEVGSYTLPQVNGGASGECDIPATAFPKTPRDYKVCANVDTDLKCLATDITVKASGSTSGPAVVPSSLDELLTLFAAHPEYAAIAAVGVMAVAIVLFRRKKRVATGPGYPAPPVYMPQPQYVPTPAMTPSVQPYATANAPVYIITQDGARVKKRS